MGIGDAEPADISLREVRLVPDGNKFQMLYLLSYNCEMTSYEEKDISRRVRPEKHLLRLCPRTERVPCWGRETRRYRMWWDFL